MVSDRQVRPGREVGTAALRRANSARIVEILSAGGVQTASSLMRLTGLTRTTVLTLCDDLIAAGWVTEIEAAPPGGEGKAGRPSRQVELAWEAAYVVGIDVGVFHATIVLANLAGEVRARARADFRAEQRNPEHTSAEERRAGVERAVDDVIAAAGVARERVLAVGIGVAAPVSATGEIADEQAYWHPLAVVGREGFGSLPGVPVLIDNDANLAARAELWCGAAQGVDHAAVILAGRRLGSGIVESGRVLHGHRGGAGELGFLSFVEGVGSADGIAYLAEQWGREAAADQGSKLYELCAGDSSRLRSEDLFAAAAAGDAPALEVTDRLADRMARVIGALATMASPEVVVLAGAIAPAAAQLVSRINAHVPTYLSIRPRIEASALGEDVVALGAIRIALDHVVAHAMELRLA